MEHFVSQQQLQQQQHYDRDAEYASARRAGSEAVLIGRETLEVATRQGEQLQRAESIAGETGYKLDKAGRVLRGMTWTGYIANMFSKELVPPSFSSAGNGDQQNQELPPPSVYEDVPDPCRAAAQAVQNYHANLKVLESCETDEQRETCHTICDNMHSVAKRELGKLTSTATSSSSLEYVKSFAQRLEKDEKALRSRQEISRRQLRKRQQEQLQQQQRQALSLSSHNATEMSKKLLGIDSPLSPQTQEILKQQNDHLDGLTENLNELGNIAIAISQVAENHGEIINSLEDKSDNVVEKSKMVTRRADRLIQKKAWSKVKPVFHSFVSIQHVTSKRYLSAAPGGKVVLRADMDDECCVFRMWKRQGEIFGLQSRYNTRWVGQSLLGSLECNANSFGRRQEWEAGKDLSETRLLCASAGWGAGSYLVVKGDTISIGSSDSEARKSADMWCLKEIQWE